MSGTCCGFLGNPHMETCLRQSSTLRRGIILALSCFSVQHGIFLLLPKLTFVFGGNTAAQGGLLKAFPKIEPTILLFYINSLKVSY